VEPKPLHWDEIYPEGEKEEEVAELLVAMEEGEQGKVVTDEVSQMVQEQVAQQGSKIGNNNDQGGSQEPTYNIVSIERCTTVEEMENLEKVLRRRIERSEDYVYDAHVRNFKEEKEDIAEDPGFVLGSTKKRRGRPASKSPNKKPKSSPKKKEEDEKKKKAGVKEKSKSGEEKRDGKEGKKTPTRVGKESTPKPRIKKGPLPI
jgi:hypothetical protein